MKAEEFVSLIGKLKPNKTDFVNKDYPEEYKSLVLSKYNIKRNKNDYLVKVNELLTLIANYNLSELDICDFHFLSEVDFYYFGNIFLFGSHDIFWIGYYIDTLEVFAYDLVKEEVFLKCALGPEEFLDALHRLKLIDSKLLTDRNFTENYELIIEEEIKICSQLAGGDDYIKFYKYLFDMD